MHYPIWSSVYAALARIVKNSPASFVFVFFTKSISSQNLWWDNSESSIPLQNRMVDIRVFTERNQFIAGMLHVTYKNIFLF